MIQLHLLVLLAGSPVRTRTVETTPAQIVLIRHAEKPDDPANPHLSAAGLLRAKQLVTFITTDPDVGRFGLPVALYATRTTNDGNGQRTQETLAPLSQALKVPVLTPYLGRKPGALARLILSSKAFAGKTVLICWNHENIPALAAALGVFPVPRAWKKKNFDRVYVISYREGKATLSKVRYGN